MTKHKGHDYKLYAGVKSSFCANCFAYTFF